MIIFNIVGIVMAAISFGIAFGVCSLLGLSGEGPLMLVGGPLAVACDALYRWKWNDSRWFHPGAGGSLFFLPLWMFGVLWLILGAIYTINGKA